ncbi:hypothetical protein [Paenibacillus hamazuiensis]|nr:hypothetical protein [Paenibacillus hamazuiensis]
MGGEVEGGKEQVEITASLSYCRMAITVGVPTCLFLGIDIQEIKR